MPGRTISELSVHDVSCQSRRVKTLHVDDLPLIFVFFSVIGQEIVKSEMHWSPLYIHDCHQDSHDVKLIVCIYIFTSRY